MSQTKGRRLLVREPCNEKTVCKGSCHSSTVGHGEHSRAIEEDDLNLVITWLREYGNTPKPACAKCTAGRPHVWHDNGTFHAPPQEGA